MDEMLPTTPRRRAMPGMRLGTTQRRQRPEERRVREGLAAKSPALEEAEPAEEMEDREGAAEAEQPGGKPIPAADKRA